MDLSYGAQYEPLRGEVRAFLAGNWPPRGADAGLSRRAQGLAFRRRAIEAGYLARAIPRRYGGSAQLPSRRPI